MDGDFACPECGTIVEVRGIAPGRQVRCGFCHRLLEVPFLPRSASTWKRRRFGRPRWVRFAWIVLGIAAATILVTGARRLFVKTRNSHQEQSIERLLTSSRNQETAGDLGRSLLDLDAALDLAQNSGLVGHDRLAELRKMRQSLVQREVDATLERLGKSGEAAFPLGAWQILIARANRDPDLSTLVSRIHHQYQEALTGNVSRELTAGRRQYDSGYAVDAFSRCEQLAPLLEHLEPESKATLQSDVANLITEIVTRHGLNVRPLQGTFVLGSKPSYVSELLPLLVQALEGKGYLAVRESSPWRSAWRNAGYELMLDVSESLEGSYLSSQNRLTRIEARLTMIRRGQAQAVFQTKPTARTAVPLPGLSSYVSGRVAASPARSEEFEKMLYTNARDQIKERLLTMLGSMPSCMQLSRN